MKMRNLLLGVFLGLLAVVHSSPVSNEEAETERDLVDEFLLPTLTTESPKRNATVPTTQQPMSEFKESDTVEGSGHEFPYDATTAPTSTTTVLPEDATQAPQSGVTSPSQPDEALSMDNDAIEDTTVMSTTTVFFLHGDEHYDSTTPSVPHAQSSTSTPFPMPSDDFSSHSSTTRAPQSGVTSPSEPADALSTDNDVIEDTTVMSTTTVFLLHGDEHYDSTTPSVPHAQSSTSTPFPMPSDDFSSHSSTTRAPQSGITSPSETTDALSTDNDVIEDTTVMSTTTVFFLHGDEHYDSTTPSVPHAQSSTSTPFPMPFDDFSSHSSTTRAPQSGVTSPSEPTDALSTENSGDFSGSGSGSEWPSLSFATTTSSMASMSTTETSTASSTSESKEESIKRERIGVLANSEGLHNTLPQIPDSPTNAGHSTPGWIIIVGFIVGVAALIMLCVAIATRDKWNGPRQASQAKANPSNQQRELEMETFMHKDNPRENGKVAEYTVIPLDELPENYSSH